MAVEVEVEAEAAVEVEAEAAVEEVSNRAAAQA